MDTSKIAIVDTSLLDDQGNIIPDVCIEKILAHNREAMTIFASAPKTDAWWTALETIVQRGQTEKHHIPEVWIMNTLEKTDDPIGGLQRLLRAYPNNPIFPAIHELCTGPFDKRLLWSEGEKKRKTSFHALTRINVTAFLTQPSWLKSIQQHFGGMAVVYAIIHTAQNNPSHQFRIYDIENSTGFDHPLNLSDNDKTEAIAYLMEKYNVAKSLQNVQDKTSFNMWNANHALQPLVQEGIANVLCSATAEEWKYIPLQQTGLDMLLYLSERERLPEAASAGMKWACGDQVFIWMVQRSMKDPDWMLKAETQIFADSNQLSRSRVCARAMDSHSPNEHFLKYVQQAIQDDAWIAGLFAAILLESQIHRPKERTFIAYNCLIERIAPELKTDWVMNNGHNVILRILQHHYPNIQSTHLEGIVQSYAMLGNPTETDPNLSILRTLLQQQCTATRTGQLPFEMVLDVPDELHG